uniref:Uncharacterized protein n=1 Tax=Anguilla anguilla TaxID=7936 RepID=A0A0E9QPE9_ANGAN
MLTSEVPLSDTSVFLSSCLSLSISIQFS